MLAATDATKQWAVSRGFAADGVVGYVDKPLAPKPSPPPGPPPRPVKKVWGFGVSGQIGSLPAGFEQESMMVHTAEGPTAAWDNWGAKIRTAYNTRKKADEDIFLAAMTLWTDNGAATLGPAWAKLDPTVKPPPYTKLGDGVAFMDWNWTMVSTEVLGTVADNVRSLGVAPRGTQLDCWWYPVTVPNHPMWCVSDWVLPEQFYPNGTGGVRQRMGTPLMQYFPAPCLENVWNEGGKYRWATGTESENFLVPTADDSALFWGDVFDYGAKLAAVGVDQDADVWPGVWAPPMVKAGWKGSNLAGYETDFYHGLVSQVPEFRSVFGAGEKFLAGIHSACAAHNMTAQICAGNPPSFFEALTMPHITNARASIDYDWDGEPTKVKNTGPRSNNGAHNWAAPDNGWVFWAARIAPSKDNFWTENAQLSQYGYGKDSGRNGMDVELHAISALLLTGPVGLGDTCVGKTCYTNATVIKRLARADGILLKPDVPMKPMDVMWGSLLKDTLTNSLRKMPYYCSAAQETQGADASCGARLWQTHASVAPENKANAPELATAPTRKLVSHASVDAADQATVPDAMASLGSGSGSGVSNPNPNQNPSGNYLLQHLVVSVDQADNFAVKLSDLYPLPVGSRDPAASKLIFYRSATLGSSDTENKKCVTGADAVTSGCVSMVASAPGQAPFNTTLFDVSTKSYACSQGDGNCFHTVGLWQVWVADADGQDVVILGDLSVYVSLSGYRFRMNGQGSGAGLVLVGQPMETVTITYLRKTAGKTYVVHNQDVTVGSTGRTEFTLA